MATDDDLAIYLAAQRALTDRVHAIGEDQWTAPTPDVEWTVADLVEHLIEEHRYAAPLLHGHDVEAASKIVAGSRSLPVDGGVGANLAEEWDEAAAASADAFTAGDALTNPVVLTRGPTPASAYLEEMTLDLVVHAWDLGVAIEYGEPLPADVVAAVYAQAAERDFADDSVTGMFDAPVEVPADASTLDRLIALTGRVPR
jgi:uncharacterized protein (TIGR03086 family)